MNSGLFVNGTFGERENVSLEKSGREVLLGQNGA
jgi:hypothetical protein